MSKNNETAKSTNFEDKHIKQKNEEKNDRKTETRVAGYCASSTKCSDQSLKKVFYLIYCLFFRRRVIKRAERKTGDWL